MTDTRPTADDIQRSARRDSLRNLLDRLQRLGLTDTEAALLRQHVDAETRDADTARAVARSNLRHVKLIVPDLERAQARVTELERQLRDADDEHLDLAQHTDQTCEAVQRRDTAEVAITRVRNLAARIRQGAPWTANHDNIADRIETELDQPTPDPAATEPGSLAEVGTAMRHARTRRDHWQQQLDRLDRRLTELTKEQP